MDSELSRQGGSQWQRSMESLLWQERFADIGLAAIATIPILIAGAIVWVLCQETFDLFQDVHPWRLLSDRQWTPLFADPQFGMIVLLNGTFLVTLIAMVVAAPLGIAVAIYLGEYAPAKVRALVKPALDALPGIPTVVLGYFALLFITPLLKLIFPTISVFNALSAGIITGLMIAPIIASMSEDALRDIPAAVREGGFALGLTRHEVILKIMLPTALPGIFAALALAASRAMGETMIAAIAAGQLPRMTLNPLETIETMTAYIIQVSLGNVQAGSLVFQTIFTVGAVLFFLTLSLNLLSYYLMRRYRQSMAQSVVANLTLAKGDELKSATILLPDRSKFLAQFQGRIRFNQLFGYLTASGVLIGLLLLASLFLVTFWSGLPRLTSLDFFTQTSSRTPANAGIFAALGGTFWLLGLTALFSLPIGIGSALYMEEYLPDSRRFQIVEIIIANLAAVPSIIFGLLGLELYVRLWEPLTGGRTILSGALTLSVLVLPFSIIATRSALRNLPNSLRQGAFAMGLTRWQVVSTVVLPAAIPGIITGSLLALTLAAGETAALVAVGASSVVPAPPLSLAALHSRFTTLSVQIFDWVSRPQAGFRINAAAAIVVTMVLLLVMSAIAMAIRNRYNPKQLV